jgi:competence protein ComEA
MWGWAGCLAMQGCAKMSAAQAKPTLDEFEFVLQCSLTITLWRNEMKKFVALIASALMLAAGAAFAQKAETPKAAPATPAPAAKAAPAPAAAATAAPAAKADAKKDPLDINTASKDELKALPGVGDAYADKIIKARGKKGFGGKDELKKVLPEKTYDGIKDMIIAKQMKKEEPKKDAKK